MTPSHRTGVLLTAFGGPDSLDAVGPFMARLMGREPAPEIVERAKAKYEVIGGASPLPGIAARVAASLESHLAAAGFAVPVRVGMRYWDPLIADAVRELADDGCDHVVMISLSPFEAKVACGAYREAAQEAVQGIGVSSLCEAPMLSSAPEFRAFFGTALAHALEAMSGSAPIVVMTAHSLPESDLVPGDPYVAGLRAVADAVAAEAGLAEGGEFTGDERLPEITAFGALSRPVPWVVAYQSRGVRPGAWLGPDLDEVLVAADRAGHDGVLLVPIGFATDHMETLYDLDFVAAERATALGLSFARTAVPNDSDLLVEAMVRLLLPRLEAVR